MGIAFNLCVSLADVHSHSPTAHRQIVARLLDEAKQVFASSAAMRGDLSIVSPNTPAQIVGSWEFTDDRAPMESNRL